MTHCVDIVSYLAQSFNELLNKDPPLSVKLKKENFRDLLSGAVGVSEYTLFTYS